MREWPRPRIVISRCLELEACRWNGQVIASDVVRQLMPYVDLVPVCPEVEIGLGVPRPPILLQQRDGGTQLVQPETGRDLTEDMTAFSQRFLDTVGTVDGFLLKSRSPSCGLWDARLYGENLDEEVGQGAGLFALAVLERFGQMPIEDEDRLTHAPVREHWLTRIYTMASFRSFRDQPSMQALEDWHSRAKYLLMAHHEPSLRRMGRLVANHDRQPLNVLLNHYQALLGAALAHPARPGPMVNALTHVLGYFSERVSTEEKVDLLACLEAYRLGRLSLSVPLGLLRGWIACYDEAYLREQFLFAPYPEALAQISDSGKGRDL
ncbi:MAG: YbgA family protein [Anaerolineae bacterium]